MWQEGTVWAQEVSDDAMRTQQIIIIGPGRMGLGIALNFALYRFDVSMVDAKRRSPGDYARVKRAGRRELRSHLNFLKKLGILKEPVETILSRVSFHEGLGRDALRGNFIFE